MMHQSYLVYKCMCNWYMYLEHSFSGGAKKKKPETVLGQLHMQSNCKQLSTCVSYVIYPGSISRKQHSVTSCDIM